MEEHPIDPALILQGQRADLVRQGKHDMVVFHGQELSGPFLEPLSTSGRLALGAMAVAA